MSEDLFQIEETLSPRLAWMKRHGIVTIYHNPKGYFPTWFAAFQHWHPKLSGEDFFVTETACNGDSRVTEADTEEEALVKLAVRHGLKHWNEDV